MSFLNGQGGSVFSLRRKDEEISTFLTPPPPSAVCVYLYKSVVYAAFGIVQPRIYISSILDPIALALALTFRFWHKLAGGV
jgi:hypothetical protein